MKAAADNRRNEEWAAKWRAASHDLKLVLQCGQEREQLVRTRIHTGKCIEVYGTNTGACMMQLCAYIYDNRGRRRLTLLDMSMDHCVCGSLYKIPEFRFKKSE